MPDEISQPKEGIEGTAKVNEEPIESAGPESFFRTLRYADLLKLTMPQTIHVLYTLIAVIFFVSLILLRDKVYFWPMDDLGEFTTFIAPLFLIALFLERALEVIVMTFMGPRRIELEHHYDFLPKIGAEGAKVDDIFKAKLELERHKAKSLKLSLILGALLGLCVSAAGIRVLEPLVDPVSFNKLDAFQRVWFAGLDIVITGALLAGGSEGLHKIVSLFTTFLDERKERIEARQP